MIPPAVPVFSFRKNFARMFRGWRLHNGLPLKAVAADLGGSLAAIQTWEKGTRFPGERRLGKIIRYTGITPCQYHCGRVGPCPISRCPFLRSLR